MLTVRQVAQQMQVTTETVRRWLRDGVLHGTHTRNSLKGHWRIPESEVRRMQGAL